MRSLLVPLLALAVAACTKATPPDPDNSAQPDSSPAAKDPENPGPRKAPGPPAGPGGADELHSLEGKTEAELLSELGPPDDKREFAMKKCCTEFQIELYNTYPPDEPAHAEVPIREWTWRYDGYSVTVWQHQVDGTWTVLETSRYADDVEF